MSIAAEGSMKPDSSSPVESFSTGWNFREFFQTEFGSTL